MSGMKQLMAIPILCAQQCTITGVISSVGVLTALAVALLQSWMPFNVDHKSVEPQIYDEPLQWQLQPPFLLFVVIILLDICHRMLSRVKVSPHRTATVSGSLYASIMGFSIPLNSMLTSYCRPCTLCFGLPFPAISNS